MARLLDRSARDTTERDPRVANSTVLGVDASTVLLGWGVDDSTGHGKEDGEALGRMRDEVQPPCDELPREHVQRLRQDTAQLVPVRRGRPRGRGEPPLHHAATRAHPQDKDRQGGCHNHRRSGKMTQRGNWYECWGCPAALIIHNAALVCRLTVWIRSPAVKKHVEPASEAVHPRRH